MKEDMLRLSSKTTPREALEYLQTVQKGDRVKGYLPGNGWESGEFHSYGRYKGSLVVYIQLDDGQPNMPRMYFYTTVKIPRPNLEI